MIKINLKTFLFLLFTVVTFVFGSGSEGYAESEGALSVNEEYRQDIKDIENYLNSITYLKSDFIQESDGGILSEGVFHLFRPGRMRIEYKTPDKIVIIANKKKLIYKDFELDEDSKVATKKTPVYFLTKEHISFDNDGLIVTDLEKDEFYKKISFVKKGKEELGELSLFFEKDSLELRAMEVKDEFGYRTKISFMAPSFNKYSESELFSLKDVKTRL